MPSETDILCYNWRGEQTTIADLRSRYGPFGIFQPPAPEGGGMVWRLRKLFERAEGDFSAQRLRMRAVEMWGPNPKLWANDKILANGDQADASLIIGLREDGNPVVGFDIAWWWPDADLDPNAGPMDGFGPLAINAGRAIKGRTDTNGIHGFGMGGGAYYWPGLGQIGPHAFWVYGSGTHSDVFLGAGMVAATAHYHIDAEYWHIYEEGGEEPPGPEPPEPPEPPEEGVTNAQILEAVQGNRVMLEALWAWAGQASLKLDRLEALELEPLSIVRSPQARAE